MVVAKGEKLQVPQRTIPAAKRLEWWLGMTNLGNFVVVRAVRGVEVPGY
jgi:hypothetical protein